jgi:hypothetical protein
MPRGFRRLRRTSPSIATAIIGVLVVVAGCASPTFDPSSPCTTDGRGAGAYPALEALVPRELNGKPPSRVDSGRSCTPASLSSLASHGVKELHFGGATWETGTSSGVSIAVFKAPGLQAEWVHEFFTAGAESARDAETVETSTMAVDGVQGYRVDALNGDSYQTVIDWADGDRVRVVIVSSFVRQVDTKAEHEATVTAALATVARLRSPVPMPSPSHVP